MLPVIFAALAVVALLPHPANAETRTIRNEVRQPRGTTLSQNQARTAAVAHAKRNALEEAGTYVRNLTVVRNAQVDQDEILALAAGALQTRITGVQPYVEAGQAGIRVVAEIELDTAVLGDRIRSLLADREHLQRLKDAERRNAELLEGMVKLENQAATSAAPADSRDRERLKDEIDKQVWQLDTANWEVEAEALWDKSKRVYYPPEKAIDFLTRAIQVPQNPLTKFAYWDRSRVYLWLGDLDKAVEDVGAYVRIATAEPETDASLLGMSQTIIREIPKLKLLDERIPLESDPSQRGILLHQRARLQRSLRNRTDLALQDVTRSIQLNPSDLEGYFYRAVLFSNQEKYNEAANEMSTYLQHSNQVTSHRQLGVALSDRAFYRYKLSRFEAAVEDYNSALKLDPSLSSAHFGLGRVYAKTKRYTRAIQEYELARQGSSLPATADSDEFDEIVARSVDMTDSDAPDLELLNSKVRQNPTDWRGFFARSYAFEKLKRYDDAINDVNETMLKYPNDGSRVARKDVGQAYFVRSRLFQKKSEYLKAANDMEQAIRLIPEKITDEVLASLADSYSKLGRSGEAIRNLSRAIRLKPDQAAWYFRRGQQYDGVRNWAAACKDFVSACELGSVRGCRTVIGKKC